MHKIRVPKVARYVGFPKIRGTFFGGLYSKDFSIFGAILGSPHFRKLPYLPHVMYFGPARGFCIGALYGSRIEYTWGRTGRAGGHLRLSTQPSPGFKKHAEVAPSMNYHWSFAASLDNMET